MCFRLRLERVTLLNLFSVLLFRSHLMKVLSVMGLSSLLWFICISHLQTLFITFSLYILGTLYTFSLLTPFHCRCPNLCFQLLVPIFNLLLDISILFFHRHLKRNMPQLLPSLIPCAFLLFIAIDAVLIHLDVKLETCHLESITQFYELYHLNSFFFFYLSSSWIYSFLLISPIRTLVKMCIRLHINYCKNLSTCFSPIQTA